MHRAVFPAIARLSCFVFLDQILIISLLVFILLVVVLLVLALAGTTATKKA